MTKAEKYAWERFPKLLKYDKNLEACIDVNAKARVACKYGYEEAEEETFDRVALWLKEHINDYIVHGRDIDLMFEDLRKSMEDER